MGQTFSEKVHQDDDGVRIVAIGQSPSGTDEWITPISMWEYKDGVYTPPGTVADPDAPRFRMDSKHVLVDGEGNEVLRIADMAPWAYDENDDTLKVKLDSAGVAIPVDLQYHDISTPLPVKDGNSDAVLAALLAGATEVKVEEVRALLYSMKAKDTVRNAKLDYIKTATESAAVEVDGLATKLDTIIARLDQIVTNTGE